MKYHENPPNVYGFGHNPLYSDVISAIIDDGNHTLPRKMEEEPLSLCWPYIISC